MASDRRNVCGATERPGTLFVLDTRPHSVFRGEGPWLKVSLLGSSNGAAESDGDDDDDAPPSQKPEQSLFSDVVQFHIPLNELAARLFEMPAKRSRIFVVSEDLKAVENIVGPGWIIVGGVDAASSSSSSLSAVSSSSPLVAASHLAVSWTNVRPAVEELRAWAPNALLVKYLPQFASLHLKAGATMVACDVGAGSGRDLAFAASLGYRTAAIALDNRRKLLENASGLVRNFGKGKSFCLECYLSDTLPLREGTVDVMILVRFLCRPLLPRLARYLSPSGGVLIFSHFVDGVQNSVVGTPKHPRDFLMRGEMRKAVVDQALPPQCHGAAAAAAATVVATAEANTSLSSTQQQKQQWLKVLIDEENTLADGRPVANLIVQRIR